MLEADFDDLDDLGHQQPSLSTPAPQRNNNSNSNRNNNQPATLNLPDQELVPATAANAKMAHQGTSINPRPGPANHSSNTYTHSNSNNNNDNDDMQRSSGRPNASAASNLRTANSPYSGPNLFYLPRQEEVDSTWHVPHNATASLQRDKEKERQMFQSSVGNDDGNDEDDYTYPPGLSVEMAERRTGPGTAFRTTYSKSQPNYTFTGDGLYTDRDGIVRQAALPHCINAQGYPEYEEPGHPIHTVIILPPNAEYFQQDYAWGFFVAGFFVPFFWLANIWFLHGHPNSSARQLSLLSALMFALYVIILAISIKYGVNPWGY